MLSTVAASGNSFGCCAAGLTGAYRIKVSASIAVTLITLAMLKTGEWFVMMSPV